MRKLRSALLAAGILASLSLSSVDAAGPRAPGFLPATAHPLGYSLVDLATAWTVWGFATGTDNPLLDVRCEQSAVDPRIWFLPVSLGGDWENTCSVPSGSFLVLFAGGNECSAAEGPPYHGGNEAELIQCVEDDLELVTYVDVSAAGVTTTALDPYLVRTRMITLPAGNLISADPTISMTEGWFLVVGPLSRGAHSFSAYDEFSNGFTAGITYTINVGG